MEMKKFGDLIYTPETASGEAVSKIETHTPKIEAPDTVKANEPFEVKVTVGPHPNKVEHSIRSIYIFFYEEGRLFNPMVLASVDLTPVFAEPEVVLKVKVQKSGVLYAVEHCNLHGLWEGRKEIKVV